MIIPAGFCQATLNFGGNGLAFPAACVLGLDQGGGATPEDVAENVYTTFSSTILPQLTNDIVLESVLVKFGPNDTGPSAEFTGTDDGGISSPGAPSNVAYLIRKNTSLGGRKGRGRMYVPGVSEATVGSDGALEPANMALIQTAVTNFGAALVLDGMAPVLLHGDATTPTPITTLVVQPVAATQRRRLRR